jgi:3-oxoacyl-[acyl-carrier-protein] synthase-3
MIRNVKIISTGNYLPERVVTATELDEKMGLAPGWCEKKSGCVERRFASEHETSPFMGARAVERALEKAGLKFSDCDALISTSGTPAQPIPCTAALIQEAMGELNSAIPSFDINATCLSFVAGLETMSYLVEAGKYNRVILVSSERASVGLNFNEKESASLMGDGAVAVIIEKTPEGEGSNIISSRFETYSEGAHWAEIRGAGSNIHPIRGNGKEDDFYFSMQGPKIFKMASKLMLPFCDRALKESGLTFKDMNLVIPHQASRMAMGLIQKKLQLSDDQFYTFVENHGNQVSASIPTGVHNAITEGKIKRGDKVMLLGTGAGFSIGALVFTY